MRRFFEPQRIVLVGASSKEGSVGRQLFANLLNGNYKGKVFPVNIKHDEILGEKSYYSVTDLPEVPDLAVIAVQDKQVLKVVKECGKVGIKSAIVISEGFGEKGNMDGMMLQHALIAVAKENGVRVFGPSSVGIISPYIGLNASISNRTPEKGNVAFISQSGAMCNAILDWGKRENVGFSHFASIGVMADINWGDILLFLGDDPHTRAIMLYMETIGNARYFLSAVREVAYTKPVIVVKPGKTEEGARVTLYNSGNLSGNHEVFQAAFRRGGVLQVESLADLFYMSSVLGKQPVPKGKKLFIITNAGAPAVLATDALIEGGGSLAALTPSVIEKLKALPDTERWWIKNPLNIHLNTPEAVYGKALEIILQDTNNNGVLFIITPQMNINMERLAAQLIPFARIRQKPLVISIMGGEETGQSRLLFTKAGIPVFSFPDVAARVFNYMWQYAYNIKGIYETPKLSRLNKRKEATLHTTEIIKSHKLKGKTRISIIDILKIFGEYTLPILPTKLVFTEEEAIETAKKIGYPVVMKLNHATYEGNFKEGIVRLNLQSKKAVRKNFNWLMDQTQKGGVEKFEGIIMQPMIQNNKGLELSLISRYDEQFGPVLELENIGRIVAAYRDKVLGLPPLNSTLAQRMLEQTKIYQSLKKSGKIEPAILNELEKLLVTFSQLVAEHPAIKKIDINPLLINKYSVSIANANIELHEPETDLSELSPLAIRPYPIEYEFDWQLKNGDVVIIRPVRPDDEPLFLNFHKTLSDESVYLRYFHSMSFDSRVAHERLARICFIDYDREIALVVINETSEPHEVLGIGRIVKLRLGNKAEFSITISDQQQGQGIGTKLMEKLILISKKEKVGELIADILPNNMGMRKVCEKFGFTSKYDMEEQVVKVSLVL